MSKIPGPDRAVRRIRVVHDLVVRAPGKPIRDGGVADHGVATPVWIEPIEGAVPAPHVPGHAAGPEPAVVYRSAPSLKRLPGLPGSGVVQVLDFTRRQVDKGKTRAQAGDDAAALAQGERTDRLVERQLRLTPVAGS